MEGAQMGFKYIPANPLLLFNPGIQTKYASPIIVIYWYDVGFVENIKRSTNLSKWSPCKIEEIMLGSVTRSK